MSKKNPTSRVSPLILGMDVCSYHTAIVRLAVEKASGLYTTWIWSVDACVFMYVRGYTAWSILKKKKKRVLL